MLLFPELSGIFPVKFYHSEINMIEQEHSDLVRNNRSHYKDVHDLGLQMNGFH